MANKQMIDAMWDDSPVDVSTEVNFIWSIANKLRGPYRSDKYKDVIIPMTIIRRFECALAPTKQKVVDQFKANPNFPAKAMYRISGFQFYNTSEFDLAELVNDADHIAANFKSYLQGFSANVLEILMSKERGLNFGEEIDKMDKNNRLLSVIKAFSELDLDPRTIDNVKMGYIFEELIRKFSENAEAGDHYTGRDIIKLMVNILLAEGCDDIFDDGKVITILDQACGTGGMLIERDYRGIKATLAYNGLPFSVPKNLYIIGMMNTADRSLAMIDYALRRRFSFFEIEPGFDSEGFIHYQNGLNNETLNELVSKVKELNREIAADKSLGKGFCIGHSYFCGKDVCTDEWLHSIVDYDILPMLSEYWFDDTSKLRRWENILQGMFQ